MPNWMKLVLASLVIIALTVFGAIYLTKSLDAKNQRDAEARLRASEALKQTQYEQCKQEAWNSYTESWNSNCKGKGLNNECLLPTYISDNLEQMRQKAESDCLIRF